jgi:hypothetical protein
MIHVIFFAVYKWTHFLKFPLRVVANGFHNMSTLQNKGEKQLTNKSGLAIDISWVDWAYKSSTCDVMYCLQRRHLYYGGQI